MVLLGDKHGGMSSGNTWLNYLRSEIAKGQLRGEPSTSSRVGRIHSLKDLNL